MGRCHLQLRDPGDKGLEVIEAQPLFDVRSSASRWWCTRSPSCTRCGVRGRSTLAQASPADMRLPIALALGWPDRIPGAPRPWTGARPPPGSSSLWTTSFPSVRWPSRSVCNGGNRSGRLQRANGLVWRRSSPAGSASRRSSIHRTVSPSTPVSGRSQVGTYSGGRPGGGFLGAVARARELTGRLTDIDLVTGTAPGASADDDRWISGPARHQSCSSSRSWRRSCCTRPGTWCALASRRQGDRVLLGFGPKIWSFRKGETSTREGDPGRRPT